MTDLDGAASGEPQPWTQRSTRLIYQNPWISVREDIALMPDGRTTIYGVVTTGPAVGVLAFVDADHVVMVRQWRYVAGRAMWEMPTGAAHAEEALTDAARRELVEESGYRVEELRLLARYHSSKSILDETCTVFVGQGAVLGVASPDPTEFMQVAALSYVSVLAMVLSGEIMDAMTVVAVLAYERERQTARP